MADKPNGPDGRRGRSPLDPEERRRLLELIDSGGGGGGNGSRGGGGDGFRPEDFGVNPRTVLLIVIVFALFVVGPRFVRVIPPGHVGVSVLFGQVTNEPFEEGIHIPVNPLRQWVLFDVRQKSHKESAQVPSRDQLQTKVDLSVQYHFIGDMAPRILKETGDTNQAVAVHLVPTLRSLVREQGSRIPRAEDFFLDETRKELENGLLSGLREYLADKGIEVQKVLIRDISLPQVLAKAIEQKKEREQAVERQRAELERFKTEQQQQVAKAEADRQAAEEEAKRRRILADARAYEIAKINEAAARNPAYIQLQSLEALKDMSKDPASKLYFMDSQSTTPLPLMHLGDAIENPRR